MADITTLNFEMLKENGLRAKNPDQSSAMFEEFHKTVRNCRFKGFSDEDIYIMFQTARGRAIENIPEEYRNKSSLTEKEWNNLKKRYFKTYIENYLGSEIPNPKITYEGRAWRAWSTTWDSIWKEINGKDEENLTDLWIND